MHLANVGGRNELKWYAILVFYIQKKKRKKKNEGS